MRKYFLGFFAISLALLLNAFTMQGKQHHSTNKTGDALIWYQVDGSNHINPSDPLNPGDPMTSDDFKSENPSLCSGSGVACVRGYEPASLPTTTTAPGVEDIQKSL